MRLNQKIRTLIKGTKVARFATVDQKSHPYVIPVVFVFHKNSFFIPLDEKTKSVNPKKLKRVKNIEKNPNTALLVDTYQNDWKKLFFIMVHGTASVIDDKNGKILNEVHQLLVSKYPQYKKTGIGNSCIKISPKKITLWKNN